MYKDDYRTALGKLAPSDAWKEDTLRKMHALEAEQARQGQTSEIVTERKRRPMRTLLRRAALPVAAVLVFAVVPLTALRGCGASGGASGAPMMREDQAKSADCAPEFAGVEGYAESSAACAPTPGARNEAGKDTVTGDSAGAAADGGETNGSQASLKDNGQKVTLPADGSTRFVFADDAPIGGVMGGLIVKTPGADELAGANPTLDLPADAMPTALPVYRTLTDSGGMYDVLQNTASILGETVTEEREGFSADTISPEDLARGVPWRVPQAFVHTESGLLLSLRHYTVHTLSFHEENALMHAPAGLTGDSLLRFYYDRYGAKLQPLENPVPETKGDYNSSGVFSGSTVFYEGGAPEDSIETKLYHYMFRRIRMDARDETGSLFVVDYTVPPEEIGVCSLRTLDEAREQLLNGEAWIHGAADGPGGYDAAAVNILHWELTYYASELTEVVQPVYRFLIDTPDGSVPTMEGGSEGCKYVTYAYVPALQDAYLAEAPVSDGARN